MSILQLTCTLYISYSFLKYSKPKSTTGYDLSKHTPNTLPNA